MEKIVESIESYSRVAGIREAPGRVVFPGGFFIVNARLQSPLNGKRSLTILYL